MGTTSNLEVKSFSLLGGSRIMGGCFLGVRMIWLRWLLRSIGMKLEVIPDSGISLEPPSKVPAFWLFTSYRDFFFTLTFLELMEASSCLVSWTSCFKIP